MRLITTPNCAMQAVRETGNFGTATLCMSDFQIHSAVPQRLLPTADSIYGDSSDRLGSLHKRLMWIYFPVPIYKSIRTKIFLFNNYIQYIHYVLSLSTMYWPTGVPIRFVYTSRVRDCSERRAWTSQTTKLAGNERRPSWSFRSNKLPLS